MKIHIVYFTSTGNTLWLAQKAKALMEQQGHGVELFEVIKDRQALDDPTASACDLLGVFYPVWGSNPPDPLVNYLQALPEGAGQRIFLVGNCCAFTGDTGLRWKSILGKKGYDVYYLDHVIMPTNINIPWLPENCIKKVPVGDELATILAHAEASLPAICEAILMGETKEDGHGLLNKIGGVMQRKFYWTANGYKSRYRVEKSRCVQCGLCHRVCPTGHITRKANDEIVFGGNGTKCIFCVKCFNLCPTNAVLICEKSIDDEKYRRYKGPGDGVLPVEYRE